MAGDSSSSGILGHPSPQILVVSEAGSDLEAAVAAMHLPGSSLSPTLSSAPSDSSPDPAHIFQKPSAPSASSDSDNIPVSPVRNSSARSTPIAIGVPRYVYHFFPITVT